jgi:hypothetical protein
MEYFMPLCPQCPAGRVDGIGGKIPMKIIAADGGKEYKTHQSFGGWTAQQQFTRLPYHKHGAQGNIKTAKNEKIEYFS